MAKQNHRVIDPVAPCQSYRATGHEIPQQLSRLPKLVTDPVGIEYLTKKLEDLTATVWRKDIGKMYGSTN